MLHFTPPFPCFFSFLVCPPSHFLPLSLNNTLAPSFPLTLLLTRLHPFISFSYSPFYLQTCSYPCSPSISHSLLLTPSFLLGLSLLYTHPSFLLHHSLLHSFLLIISLFTTLCFHAPFFRLSFLPCCHSFPLFFGFFLISFILLAVRLLTCFLTSCLTSFTLLPTSLKLLWF